LIQFENTLKFARSLDRADKLRAFRKEFHIPSVNGKKAIYFTGNSLGLQPVSAKKFLKEELDDWATLGVDGHMIGRRPWVRYQKFTKKHLAMLTGAKPEEVVAMNQLTVNLHLMMVSFYRPTRQRFKIITELGAFSSDQYAIETQLKFHGLDPAEALIELQPRATESFIRTEDIEMAIAREKDQLALVLFGGVQYYTGQFFNIPRITKAAHDAGAIAGFDLAHAIGNVPLNLHDDDVDFAVWCSYKYLNSGPGGIAGAFVHERFANDRALPRFAGWWGHDEGERFQMKKGFKAIPGIDGWQVSNHPVLLGASHLAALEIFRKAGLKNLFEKSRRLTNYLEYILNELDPSSEYFRILTPSDVEQRGCQLSIFMIKHGKHVFKKLNSNHIIADWREPGVIRVAPVPLYNTFEEVFRFGEIFGQALKGNKK
jgi:kynureninase